MPILVHHARVLGIGAQRGTTMRDEVQHPVQLRIGERAVRARGPQLGHDLGAREAAADGTRHEMLRQQVERPVHGVATLDPAVADRVARSSDLHELEGMRGHAHDLRDAPR